MLVCVAGKGPDDGQKGQKGGGTSFKCCSCSACPAPQVHPPAAEPAAEQRGTTAGEEAQEGRGTGCKADKAGDCVPPSTSLLPSPKGPSIIMV